MVLVVWGSAAGKRIGHRVMSSRLRGQHARSEVLVNVGVDSFTNGNKLDGTFPAAAAHHSQHHLLQRSLGVGNDEDARPPRPQGGPLSSDCWGDCRPCPT